MMIKNKKIILIIAAAAVIIFFIVDTIKGIQTTLNRKKNLTNSERFIEDFGSFENYSFNELTAKENFGSFTSFEFSFYSSNENKDMPFYGTVLERGLYIYKNNDLIKNIMEVFQKYNYTYSKYDFQGSQERTNLIWSCCFYGYNGLYLTLSVYQVIDADTLLIYMSTQDDFGGSTARGWFLEHDLGMFTDENLSEDVCKLLLEHTKQISLEKIEQILSENTGELSSDKLFGYQNSMEQSHEAGMGNTLGNIYKQNLEDSEDYILVYTIKPTDGKKRKYNCIFKIELYGEDEVLKEILYDDTERYERI